MYVLVEKNVLPDSNYFHLIGFVILYQKVPLFPTIEKFFPAKNFTFDFPAKKRNSILMKRNFLGIFIEKFEKDKYTFDSFEDNQFNGENR